MAEKVAVTNPPQVIEVVPRQGFTLEHLTLLRLDSLAAWWSAHSTASCFVFSQPHRFRPIAALVAPFVSFCTAPRPPISRNTSVVSYTWKPYYRRHDKIPPRRRRPLLECWHHYELWQDAMGRDDTTRIVSRAVMGTFKDCTWGRYIRECGREKEFVRVLYRTVRHCRQPSLQGTSRTHDKFSFKMALS